MMNKWFLTDGKKMLPWVSAYLGLEQKQDGSFCPWFDLIYFIFRIQLTLKAMWVFSVSKRENALKTSEKYQNQEK